MVRMDEWLDEYELENLDFDKAYKLAWHREHVARQEKGILIGCGFAVVALIVFAIYMAITH